MSAYHTPAEGPTMPRSEAIHGALAGRPMVRWRQDNAPQREALIAGLEQSIAAAKRLVMRHPTVADVTGDYAIQIEQREVVHAIINRAYDTLYDAIDALEQARWAVDSAHQRLGYIPSEWTAADTLRWAENPDLWGCTEKDVARVERIRTDGPFHTPAQESL